MSTVWIPEGAIITEGCGGWYTTWLNPLQCVAVGWRFPEKPEVCHCGDYVNNHGAGDGHAPVSMGHEPTYKDDAEGWCPDHGFWYYDLAGDVAYYATEEGREAVIAALHKKYPTGDHPHGQAEPPQGT